MKHCPACQQNFDDDLLSFCLNDGTKLVSAPSSSSPNSQETLHIPAPRSTDPTQPQSWGSAQAYSPMPAAAPPAAGTRNMLPWILGGVAALLIGLIGLFVIGGIVYFKMKSSGSDSDTPGYSSTTSKPQSGTRSSSNRSTTSQTGTPKTPLGSATRSFDDIAPQQVGAFKLSGIKKPSGHVFTTEGSTDLMMATYDLSDNSNFALLYMASFGSSSAAAKAIENIIKWSVNHGAKIERQETNAGTDGTTLGPKYVLVNKDGEEEVYWSNGAYAFNAYNGKTERGVMPEFERAFPY